MVKCEAEEIDGRYVCKATHCPHHLKGGGCKLGKVSITCDNNKCDWNIHVGAGIYRCKAMDIHLDASGRCLHCSDKGD